MFFAGCKYFAGYISILIHHLTISKSKSNEAIMKEITTNLMENLSTLQGRSQNQKQVPQNFMKFFDVDHFSLTSQLMTSNRKSNVASEK